MARARKSHRGAPTRIIKRHHLQGVLLSLVVFPAAQSHTYHGSDGLEKFYTPASHVVCMRRAIPYHVTFTGPPLALATLLTYMPSRMGAAAVRACSRIQLLRQTSVDVKCVRVSLSPVPTTYKSLFLGMSTHQWGRRQRCGALSELGKVLFTDR